MKKKLTTLVASSALAFSMMGTDLAKADTNFDAIKLADIELLQTKGIVKGFSNGELGGDQLVTRAQLLIMLDRAGELGEEKAELSFKDINTQEHKDVVAKAIAANLIEGLSETEFGPNDTVNKEQFAKIITLALTDGTMPTVDESVLNNFTDVADISDWARPYVAYSLLAGVFDVKNGEAFGPQDNLIREEASDALKPVLFDVVDILSTNDIHGNIEFDEAKQRGGMAVVGGIVDAFRSVNADGTVVLDGGDIMQGTLISNSFEGASTIDTLNSIEYDAAAIGNHEFDWGVDVLKERIAQAELPIMGANVFDEATNTRVDWAEPYVILEKGDYKIGVIGFATPETKSTTLSTHVEGLTFPTPASIAEELAKELKDQGVDLIFVTSHLPGWAEEETNEIVGELADLADASAGSLDAIVGGHSHKRVAGIVNGIPVIEAEKYTRAIGHIKLFVDRDSKEVVSQEVGLLETNINLTALDADTDSIVKDYQTKVKEVENEVVGSTNGELTRDYSEVDFGVSQLGNMITDAMREKAGTQIAFQNSGGIRENIDAGEINYGEVFKVLPFDNYNVTADMTAQQLKVILEGPEDRLLQIQFSGVKVIFDDAREIGDRIIDITLTDGTPVYTNGEFAEGTFSVVTNNFLSTGEGDGYTAFGEVEWTDSTDFQRELFADYLRAMTDEVDAASIMDDRFMRNE
ncbi:5'-nucleotidase C-terminal domain-containing protein [Cytobacillus sp. IB215665]|uniref:5'-nucleotidase C-terminal domain-containing protein n=1 Tax=Cytobacillus sp. IB215665 TaxID=3097357 RepID=UPI002A0DD1D7|nr:5'-nucleotidase C-terminal domain-containing protein [Cytobacillus sp. IB215665]MDX8363795.1 5'-nucleotidase C-terminal domain-containing protein [Cytobacillus sp. IB215665]